MKMNKLINISALVLSLSLLATGCSDDKKSTDPIIEPGPIVGPGPIIEPIPTFVESISTIVLQEEDADSAEIVDNEVEDEESDFDTLILDEINP